MDYRLLIFILIIVSVVAGFILGHYVFPDGKPTGQLIVDTSDPEKDRWFLKLDEPTDKAAKKHRVILQVFNKPIHEGDPKWPNER